MACYIFGRRQGKAIVYWVYDNHLRLSQQKQKWSTNMNMLVDYRFQINSHFSLTLQVHLQHDHQTVSIPIEEKASLLIPCWVSFVMVIALSE